MSHALFAYGSLASLGSLRATIGPDAELGALAQLSGWRRRWSVARDNRRAEKRFAPPGGEPFEWCLLLNLERDPEVAEHERPNGVLIEVTESALERLDARELRYHRVELGADLGEPAQRYDRVYAYVARPEHFAPTPPPDAVVLAAYLAEVEAAFAELGDSQLTRFRASTQPPPAPVVDAELIESAAPPGNPQGW